MTKAFSYIRFSTAEQERGDSLRRQVELSEAYAEKHGIELDTTLSLRDLGISAFNGAHRGKGKLGEFLKLVDQGKIPVGSVLLVESFDRLSREEITEALEQFLTLIRKGIQIVTLSDQRSYTKETINSDMGQLIISITIMSRAHEESLIKSQRVRAAWDSKRAKIPQKKLTAQCPEWLCLPTHKREYEVIPDRAEIIRQIFQLKIQGHGSESVRRILNETDRFWNPGGWRKSYVEKILRYPSVYGAYQPYSRHGNAKTPIGDPIPGYYPEIVSEEIFNRVQVIFHKNHRKGGQTGALHNLFTHLVKCGYCGTAMHHYGGGKYHYLVCANAYHRQGCDYLSVHYLEIEEVILKYCQGLDPNSLLPPTDETQNNLRLLEDQLASHQFKLERTETRIDNLADEIADTPRDKKLVRELLVRKLEQALQEKETLGLQLIQIQQELDLTGRNGKDISEHLKSINELYAHLARLDAHERIELRLRLRMELRRLIRKIEIYAEGDPRYSASPLKESLREMYEKDRGKASYKDSRAYIEHLIENAKNELKIVIEFTSGTVREIYPRRQNIFNFCEYDAEARELLAEHRGIEF